jgi:hypothetical protein
MTEESAPADGDALISASGNIGTAAGAEIDLVGYSVSEDRRT